MEIIIFCICFVVYHATLGDFVSVKSKMIDKTMEAIPHLLYYTATNQNMKIRYHKIIMILQIHSNGLYISSPKSVRYVGGDFFHLEKNLDSANYKHNGPIHIIAIFPKNFMYSAAEAEILATHVNAQEAVPLKCLSSSRSTRNPQTQYKFTTA